MKKKLIFCFIKKNYNFFSTDSLKLTKITLQKFLNNLTKTKRKEFLVK